MCQSRVVQVRISQRQHQLLLNRMENAGYRTISSFVRDAILKDDLTVLNLVKEIHKKVVGGVA